MDEDQNGDVMVMRRLLTHDIASAICSYIRVGTQSLDRAQWKRV